MRRVALLLLVFGLVPAAHAAPTIFVDPSHPTCRGRGWPGFNCFSTIQAGVRHATAPARIYVLPGTYRESVDLSEMGADVGGAPGDIKLVGIWGRPFVSPPTGRAFSNDVAPYPGSIEIHGFSVTSPDRDAINLDDVLGAVTLGHVWATDARYDGVDIDARGKVTIGHCHANRNGNDGFQIVAEDDVYIGHSWARDNTGPFGSDGFDLTLRGAAVLITRSGAERNGNDGFEFDIPEARGLESLTIHHTRSQYNGVFRALGSDGFDVSGREDGVGNVELRHVKARYNGEDGFQIPSNGALMTIYDAEATGNGGEEGDGFELGASGASTRPTVVTARHIRAYNNGTEGIEIAADQRIEISDCVADGNGVEEGDGVQLRTLGPGSTVHVERCHADGNRHDGIEANAEAGVYVSYCSAHRNGLDEDPAAEGASSDGLDLLSRDGGPVEVSHCTANGNADDGISAVTSGVVYVTRSHAHDNGANTEDGGNGFLISGGEGGPPSTVSILYSSARGNRDEGFQAEARGPVEHKRLCAKHNDGNGVLVKGIPGPVEIDSIDALYNGEAGICLQDAALGADLRVASSNIAGNSNGFVLGDDPGTPADATHNWWGSSRGPTHPNNPGGNGDTVFDGFNGAFGVVDYIPFLSRRAYTRSSCRY